jgi:PIN domain nuclease of toxin-antitoxin system
MFGSSHRFGKQAKKVLEKAETIYFSPVSFFEIELKKHAKKLRTTISTADVLKLEFVELTYRSEDAVSAARFSNLETNDPFDVMLLAQAANNNLKFLTADQIICRAGLDFVIDLTS